MGWSSARQLKESQADIIARRARNAKDFDRLSLDAIRANPGLYRFAQAGGQALFKENCAPCHGSGAAGRTGYPNLNDDDWLWGGTLQDVYKTIQHGIRAKDEQTRSNVMPNFGADGILPPADVDLVSTYVLSLSEPSTPMTPAQREAGSKLFADNCASCHGAKGEGLPEMGGPRLSDKIWLYGSGKEAIARQVNKARAGVMPSWSQRLPDSSIKQLAIYIDSLGGTRKAAAAGAPATGPVAEKTAAQ